jgi:hypothetical protein
VTLHVEDIQAFDPDRAYGLFHSPTAALSSVFFTFFSPLLLSSSIRRMGDLRYCMLSFTVGKSLDENMVAKPVYYSIFLSLFFFLTIITYLLKLFDFSTHCINKSNPIRKLG